MRKVATILGISIGLLSILPASAGTMNLATGLDSSGNLQTTGGSIDANWLMTGGTIPLDPPNAYVVDPTDADWYGGWIANGPNSSWICANPNTSANGFLDATLSFTLTASQVSSATFSNVLWTLDDSGELLLNGVVEATQGDGQWGTLNAATLNPADLVVGTNTLEMRITATDDYLEGVRLEGTMTTTPEPPTFLAVGLGMGALLIPLRRKNRK